MYKIIKRILDFFLSLLLIVFLAPLFLIIALLIFIAMGSPVFFYQDRTGLNNKPFKIFKFRTMRIKNDEYFTDEQRITWIGSILRLFRMDELPQLFNILIGEMSFIGPRPLLPHYLPYYNEEEIRRHQVRPGLSGMSQVSNLNYPKWEEQFQGDTYYVDNLSFKLDFAILLKTVLKIIKPNVMMKTGISGGRLNFDIYRKLQLNEGLDVTTNSNRIVNK